MKLSKLVVMLLSLEVVSHTAVCLGCPLPLFPWNACSKNFEFDKQRRDYVVNSRTKFAKQMNHTLVLDVGVKLQSYLQNEMQNNLAMDNESPSERNFQKTPGTEFLCNWTYRIAEPNSAEAIEARYPDIPMEQWSEVSQEKATFFINGKSCQCRKMERVVNILKFTDCDYEKQQEKWGFEARTVTVGYYCALVK